MTPWQRFWIGAGGGVVPLAIDFYYNVETALAAATAFMVAVYFGKGLFLACGGGLWALRQRDEDDWFKLMQFGMVGPAMFAGLINASAVSANSAPGGAERAGLFTAVVHAQGLVPAPRELEMPQRPITAQLKQALLNRRSDAPEWILVVTTTRTQAEAARVYQALARGYPSFEFVLYEPAPELGVPGWTLTLGPQQPQAAATAMLERASQTDLRPRLVQLVATK